MQFITCSHVVSGASHLLLHHTQPCDEVTQLGHDFRAGHRTSITERHNTVLNTNPTQMHNTLEFTAELSWVHLLGNLAHSEVRLVAV